MTSEQKHLVQQTWAHVAPIADTAAALFYDRLFTLDPTLRTMFRATDMKEQGRKLMQMLAVAVKSLGDLDKLLPAVEALGRRHAGYGVKDEHYAVVGEALLWTLAKGMGARFTDPVRDAWAQAYTTLAGVMRSAAAAEPVPA